MLSLTHELLDKFRELVYEASDLHFTDKKLVFFERRLRERLLERGFSDYPEYYQNLLSDQGELTALVQSLTTNKTFFFRDRAQFAQLRDVVLPAIMESRNAEVIRSWSKQGAAVQGKNPAMSIRIWSLGCSTGEEAYSIAFTLLETVRYQRAWDLDVLATDLSGDVLKTARAGVYGESSVKEMPAELRDRYMVPTPSGWSVSGAARGLVRFMEGNVKELSAPGGTREITLTDADGVTSTLDARGMFDIIFCRNVMIYFDREGQQRLVDALFDCLKPGGYLFTGDSEPLHLFVHGFERTGGTDALYYKKPDRR